MDPKAVDEWIRVSDRDSFVVARQLAREEGLLVGGSGGTTVWAALELARRLGPGKTILSMLPDSGRSYLSKFYDDNWMLEHGFVERRTTLPTVEQLLAAKRAEDHVVPDLVTISSHQKVGEAIDVMQRYSISQLPVVRDGSSDSLADFIGSLQDRDLLDRVFKNPDALHEDVVAAMQPPLAAVDIGQSLDQVFSTLTGRTNAVVVASDGRPVGVLTRSDLLEYLAHNSVTAAARGRLHSMAGVAGGELETLYAPSDATARHDDRRRRPLPDRGDERALRRPPARRAAPARQRRARSPLRVRQDSRNANQDEGDNVSEELRERIKSVIDTERVTLFMKGTPQFVMCGNSERALQALRGAGAPVTAVDVLPDPEIRQELSSLSGWPTIPQVFIGGELVGGADIVQELAATGELEQKLSESLGDDYRDEAEERVVSVLVPA